jgi:hypothetical protein
VHRGDGTHGSAFSLDATLCFINLLSGTHELNIWSTDDGNEPQIGWDSQTGTWNTDSIRATFDDAMAASSHVMQFTPPDVWEQYKPNQSAFYDVESMDHSAIISIFFDTVALFAKSSDSSDGGMAHRILTAIFQDTLHEKGPAFAMQTIFTVLMQMSFYDMLPQFDYQAPVEIASSETQSIPAGWTGLAIVLAALGIHLIVFLIITALYFSMTKTTMLGNAWQAVKDVVEKEEAAIVLQCGRPMTDKEVAEMVKNNGQGGEARLRGRKT